MGGTGAPGGGSLISANGLALVRSEGGDIDEPCDFGVVARFCDHGSAIGVTDENHGAVLRGRTSLVAATSSANDTVGFWTMLTL